MRSALFGFFALLVLSVSAHAQETATVISEGIGKDIESAAQRAAEAALTQVVGSFIDSNKLIEKQREIRDGIKTQSKSITSKISEYSQGSIQRLDILDVYEDDGLTRVTAKVTVRIEDFKHYIKETVLAEKKLKKGLLGQMKVKKKQQTNLADLLIDKVIQPIVDYQVVIPKVVGDPIPVETAAELREFNPGPDEHVIAIKVEVNLDPDYLDNAVRVLEETAKNKVRNICNKFRKPNKSFQGRALFGLGAHFGKQKAVKCLNFTVGKDGHAHEAPVYYVYPKNLIHLCDKLIGTASEKGIELRDTYGGRAGSPKLNLKFMTSNGAVIREELLEFHSRAPGGEIGLGFREWWSPHSKVKAVSGHVPSIQATIFPSSRSSTWDYVESQRAPYLFFVDTGKDVYGNSVGPAQPFSCGFFIMKSTIFWIMTKVTEDVLGRADKIVLSYIK